MKKLIIAVVLMAVTLAFIWLLADTGKTGICIENKADCVMMPDGSYRKFRQDKL